MAKTKIVVYGLSTEGYALASEMAIKGADVRIIDESMSSAISLNAEIAKTYPNVSSLKEDEPLLAMEPTDVAISKAQYLFFTPRIRKTGQDTKTEVHSQFKEAVAGIKKNSSVVFALPTGFGGNNENIALLEHVTGFKTGKQAFYFYYPLAPAGERPRVIGSFGGREDPALSELLGEGRGKKRFVAVSSAERFHAINVLSKFSKTCSVLEVYKHAQDEAIKKDLSSDSSEEVFLDDMVNGLFDLKSLNSSFEGTNTPMYLINGGIKGVDGYVKRLVDEIRRTLKRNEIKASRIRVALSWTLDPYTMRGDKIEVLETLTARLHDYISDVDVYEESNSDLFHTDKTTIILACSKPDFESVKKAKWDSDLIIVKANALCEIIFS